MKRQAKHLQLVPLETRRERVAGRLARSVCRVIGHDPENRFTGDTICHRCRAGLGRWRS